jgi:hypothetical protein
LRVGPITFMAPILLAHEFSVLRANEVSLTREVINVRGNVYPHDQIAVAGHARWRRLAFVWAKAEEQTKKANAAGTISFAIIVAVSET